MSDLSYRREERLDLKAYRLHNGSIRQTYKLLDVISFPQKTTLPLILLLGTYFSSGVPTSYRKVTLPKGIINNPGSKPGFLVYETSIIAVFFFFRKVGRREEESGK